MSNKQFDPEKPSVSGEWEGEFIYTSWGYGQTNVEMAKITEVSDTGKTVLAKLVVPERVSTAKASESVAPTEETYGEEFRLYVRNSGGRPAFRGSYPYINGDPDEGTRRVSFVSWDGVAGDSVHQTAPGYGH